jgi:glycosyltransferase involved in cell wall biosynthesis
LRAAGAQPVTHDAPGGGAGASAAHVRLVERAGAVAVVDWSQLIEDYLDHIGVSFEAFCREMSGGWMFGYLSALRAAGVRATLFVVSARVRHTRRHNHLPTGATVVVLPAPRAYRFARRRVLNPYAETLEGACGEAAGLRRAWLGALREVTPYLSTPPARLARALGRERCDAVLCQDYEHGRFDLCLAVGRLLGLPVFATFQGGDRSLGKIERLARGFALRRADGFVTGDAREAERLRRQYGVRAERIARVFNPLDLADWPRPTDDERAAARSALDIPSGASVVAWHGRVDFRRKGLDLLLAAWGEVTRRRAGRDLRLLLVGTGNDERELREAVARLKPPGLVRVDEFVQSRARLRGLLLAADLYAFPSRREGFPVAPVEALAAGLPVVAADAPGVADILGGGEESGGVVVSRDDMPALAAALGRLLDDEGLRRALAARARARAEAAFSPAAVGAQLRDFILKRARD